MQLDPNNPRTVRVFVSSPSDAADERRLIDEIAELINGGEGMRRGYRLELIKWENMTRQMGIRPQRQINDQTPDYDIHLGILGQRFGTPTGAYGSGTEEELRTALRKWRTIRRPRVMFFFSRCEVDPHSLDLGEFAKVRRFRQELEPEGLYSNYQSLTGGKNSFKERVTAQLCGVIDLLDEPGVPPTVPVDAVRHVDQFDVSIQVDGDGRIRLRGETAPLGKIKIDQVDRDVINFFHKLLLTHRIQDVDELKVMGKLLFRAMFTTDLLETFESKLAEHESQSPKRTLRLALHLEDNPALAALPWEYMYYEGSSMSRRFFLAARTDLHLTRRFRHTRPVEIDSCQLKILIVAADPDEREEDGPPAAKIAQELKDKALGHPILKDRCEVHVSIHPLLDEFERLVASGFHVVHIIGRRVSQADGYRIAWPGQKFGLDGQSINFGPKPPKLLLLQLRCSRVEPEPEPVLLPAQLVEAGIPMVVTMHPAFTPEWAVNVSIEFYAVLADYGTSGEAITQARKLTMQSALRSNTGFGMPVLYLSCEDTAVLKSKPALASPELAGIALEKPAPPLNTQQAHPAVMGSDPSKDRANPALGVAVGQVDDSPFSAHQPPKVQAAVSATDLSVCAVVPIRAISAMKTGALQAARELKDFDVGQAREAIKAFEWKLPAEQMNQRLVDLIRESEPELCTIYQIMLDVLEANLAPT